MGKPLAPGEAIGIRIGIQKGEAKLLIKQLEHRFGKLSSPYLKTIRNADAETLLRWGEKILDAKKLKDVFERSTSLSTYDLR